MSEVGDLASVEAFLVDRLAQPLPGAPAHWRFAPTPALAGWQPDLTPDTARRAAALILIYPGASGPSIALTKRRADLPHHPGQISLPGGALDAGESPQAAALRETEEEIGVDPQAVRIVGALSTLWVVVSNFVVHPFVAVTSDRPTFRPEPREVDQLIEAPLGGLRDPTALHWDEQVRRGVRVYYPHFNVDGHAVWGATAMILGEFACLFDAAHGPPDREGPRR
jgi:8-oxo-dGTP pyrophosphatase MutT (NUDIX family)